MKKLLVASALALTVALTSAGCSYFSASDVADTAATTTAVLTLNLEYDTVKADLNREISKFPEDVQVKLKDLESETDKLVADAQDLYKTNPVITALSWEIYYLKARVVYFKGKELIDPYYDTLDENVKQDLQRFKAKAALLDAQFQKLSTSQADAAERQDMLRAGMELATLALTLGLRI